jgi:hypothetical protein
MRSSMLAGGNPDSSKAHPTSKRISVTTAECKSRRGKVLIYPDEAIRPSRD